MRVIVGIDHETYPVALDLLRELRFGEADLQLIHVIESPLEDLPSVPLEPVHEWLDNLEAEGRKELSEAARRLEGTAYRVETVLLHGDTPKVLIERARAWEADLIAIGSSQKGHWGALFYGSVTKAVAAGADRSVLVAKQSPQGPDGLRVVIATDHSDYFQRCFEKFLSWEISSIRFATVLTSLSRRDFSKEARLEAALNQLRGEVASRNESLCETLRARGIEATSVVSERPPQEAIAVAMQESGADLLILGAQGHGFWDRVRLGSVSYYEVIATDHNVLVVRA
jgi:nucleotide-binding universal stress UspA family protein